MSDDESDAPPTRTRRSSGAAPKATEVPARSARRVVSRKIVAESENDEEAEEDDEEARPKASSSSRTKRSKRTKDDDDFVDDAEVEDDDLPRSSKSKAGKRQRDDDDDDDDGNGDDDGGGKKKKSKGGKTPASSSRKRAVRVSSAGKPTVVTAGKFELLPLKLDTSSVLAGEPKRPIKYVVSEKAQGVLEDIAADKLNAAVSATVRLVLGLETIGKKVTGTDIKKQCLEAFPESEVKHVMPYVRKQAARRFQSVFGFDLHAGDEADKVKLPDRWYLTNSLKSVTLSTVANAGVDEAMDKARAQMMTVLALLMLSDHVMTESDLVGELETLDFTVKQANELLKTLKDEGFIERMSHKTATGQTVVEFKIGLKTDLELGRRAILQFLMSAVGVSLDLDDEDKLLRLSADAEEKES